MLDIANIKNIIKCVILTVPLNTYMTILDKLLFKFLHYDNNDSA